METEVKLAFDDPSSLSSIVTTDWFSTYCMDSSEKEPETLDNSYFDTADRKLSSRGATIRVRHYKDCEDDECYEHTVKYGGNVENGLHQRYEWNVRTDKSKFSISEFIRLATNQDDPNELLKEVLEGINDDEIVKLCSTVFERTTYTVGYGDSMMEACLDVGKIESNNESEDICELELELTSGDVVDLKDFATFIVEQTDAKFFNDSKFRRALKLLDKNKEA